MFLSVQSIFKPTSAHIQVRVSTMANGAEVLGSSFKPVFSPDGRYVAFESDADDLVSDDGNGAYDIFLKDLISGAITRITVAGNTEANAGNFDPRFSPDGRYVLFESAADNLVSGDKNGVRDIFLKELATGEITRLSMAGETEANGSSFNAQFSPDGHYVLFESAADNLVEGDKNGVRDIFLKELATREITRLSMAGETEANGDSYAPRLSPDGRYVLFESWADNLVEGDENTKADIFLKELATGEITRISTAANDAEANDESYAAQFSPDGHYVLFESAADNLVEGDMNEAVDVFLKDLVTGAVMLVSAAADGTQANGGGFSAQFSPDGRYVLFGSTASNLVAGDTNNNYDIFLKDLSTGSITRLSTTPDGAGANGGSFAGQFSADGRYAVFDSGASNLVAGDANGASDIFVVDLLYKANAAAILENRFIETTLAVGNASSASIAWGDGTSSTVTPTNGSAAFNHAYASTGVKTATVILTEGALTWSVAHSIDLGTGTMARNTALADTLTGSAGSDILTGDAFSNILNGAGGNDRIDGGAGADVMDGGAGDDTYVTDGLDMIVEAVGGGIDSVVTSASLSLAAFAQVENLTAADGTARLNLTGNSLANILTGNAGANRLSGGSGNDRLEAGSGNDVLSAGSGNDRLFGGRGQDKLTGGSGRDVFAFDDRETSASKKKADYILDFSRRKGDRIDLKAIDANTKKRGDQKFSFIGDDKSFSKAGQVRFEKTKSATYVYLNTDNDRSAEAVIKLKGALELQKSWFVL